MVHGNCCVSVSYHSYQILGLDSEEKAGPHGTNSLFCPKRVWGRGHAYRPAWGKSPIRAGGCQLFWAVSLKRRVLPPAGFGKHLFSGPSSSPMKLPNRLSCSCCLPACLPTIRRHLLAGQPHSSLPWSVNAVRFLSSPVSLQVLPFPQVLSHLLHEAFPGDSSFHCLICWNTRSCT